MNNFNNQDGTIPYHCNCQDTDILQMAPKRRMILMQLMKKIPGAPHHVTLQMKATSGLAHH